ncbi:MAG: nickel pincer cofactor biosynthesis protein LarC [Coriobacteriales bacterium]|nr:nickel pincer cofactor biosynthesis protein LarC [Coriobacteriales bacterium]
MTRILQLQCDRGISGDMLVGALLDLGADEKGLRKALQGLQLEGYHVEVSRKLAGALDACDFDVVMDPEFQNHDHDMEWLYGEESSKGDTPHRLHGHGHGHEHHQHHANRNLADIQGIIEGWGLSKSVQNTALRIFTIIAEAEAKAHGQTVDSVHFHEVGAVDSIVDVVSVAWCLDNLGIQEATYTPLAEGEGHVHCAHGVLPIPVPAVANIVEAHGLVLRHTHFMGELVTPTGAAVVAAICNRAELPRAYRVLGTGIGMGKRAYDPPSMLRAILVEDVCGESHESGGDALWKLETEVDDCTGEALGYVMGRLYEAGAREAHFVPVFMKKGRPGYQIEVLCNEGSISALEEVLFEDTTTIGIRRFPVERTVLQRSQQVVEVEGIDVRIKRVVLPSGERRDYPEHDSVAMVAKACGISYQDALGLIRRHL